MIYNLRGEDRNGGRDRALCVTEDCEIIIRDEETMVSAIKRLCMKAVEMYGRFHREIRFRWACDQDTRPEATWTVSDLE